MLTRWHYVALIAPVLLLLLEWRSPRPLMVVVLFVAILLASAQAITDVRIRSIRITSPVPISALPRLHPVRRRFGVLHGISSLLLLAEVVAAGIVVSRGEG